MRFGLPIELVVFDMAGTTVSEGGAVYQCLRDTLAANGLETPTDALQEVKGMDKYEALRILIERSAMREQLLPGLNAIHEDFVERMIEFYRADPAVGEAPGANETFRRLRQAGVKVALNTGFSFTFVGATKKVAYEGSLEGAPVAPIQAINSVVSTIIALAGAYLFLKSYFTASLLFAMAGMQVWRFLSEKLRADHRGMAQKISAYQVMALLMAPYAAAVVLHFPSGQAEAPEIAAGLGLLWDPAVLLFCQAVWLAVFLIAGRSMAPGSTLSFFVRADRI
jgi:haloacid dehalogenase-like hydrolase